MKLMNNKENNKKLEINDQIEFITSLMNNSGNEEAKFKFKSILDTIKNYKQMNVQQYTPA